MNEELLHVWNGRLKYNVNPEEVISKFEWGSRSVGLLEALLVD
jgi:hypothetical protein